MHYIDISWPLASGMTEYKNKNSFVSTVVKTIEHDHCFETTFACNAHTGTHIDAPAHFIPGGVTIDQIDLASCNGSCIVLDFTEVTDCITAEHLQHRTIPSGSRVLLKTKNSFLADNAPFDPAFVYLTADGARYLRDLQCLVVGIDYLGIERNQPGHPTHKELLGNNVLIIEGLRLASVAAGEYMLTCLPLRMVGADAAPARCALAKR